MNVLEKILEEIEIEEQKQRQVCKGIIKSPGYRIYEKAVGIVKEIIRSHMDELPNGIKEVSKEHNCFKPPEMAKGFIVVDVPETCLECRFCVELHEGIEAYCALMNNPYNRDEFKEIDVSYPQDKPDWCPIRKFPEKKEPSQFPVSPALPWEYTDYEKGWNHCLDYLEDKHGNL